jgi:transposase
MFVRKKINLSGSVSIQILQKVRRNNKLIQTVGSSSDVSEIDKLYKKAYEILPSLKNQSTINFYTSTDETILNFTKQLTNSSIRSVGAQLVFGKLFDSMGFGVISNELFKDLVISRIVYQGSKLKLVDYLRRYENREISIQRIYRFLDKFHSVYKDTIEEIAFNHTKKVLTNITVVFYDMTTLYFESGDEDDFRKIGFSKDGKFQNPQIMLGLLVGEYGYPIGYELFDGNIFEGHTLIPVLEKFQKKFNLVKPIVIADSGLLSKANIQQLKTKDYQYILGARIRNSDAALSQKILDLKLIADGDTGVIANDDGDRLVVSYTDKRARNDEYNRTKGLRRLEKRVKSGKLTKDQINSRGYNKYLLLQNEISVVIDYDKFHADGLWDGLKGYTTNTSLSAQSVISNYSNLWQIEKAFRMSKSDLEIRPIYHFTKRRIEAHISISFVAYSIYKELERLLYKYDAPFSVKKAREIVSNIYQLEITLPESKVNEKIMLNMDGEQQFLVDIVQKEVSRDVAG